MNLAAKIYRRLPWLNLPTGALIALLQRSPAVQAVASAASYVAVSPIATVLKSATVGVAALGAVDALAGATALIESNNQSSLNLTVGTAMTPVIFGVSNTINIGSWMIDGTFPPGLKIVAAEGGASLSGPGLLDATTSGYNTQTTPILQGTPTTAGTYTLTIQAFEFSGAMGLASNMFNYTITVSGTGSTSGGGGSSSSGSGSSSSGSSSSGSSGSSSSGSSSSGSAGTGSGAAQPLVAAVTVDGHSSGDTLALAAGTSGVYQITARFKASASAGNLSGIRFNLWNPPAGSAVPGTGLFNNGGGFAPESGGSGELVQAVTLTPGDWYFWTDAQDAAGDNASTGAWTSGFVLHVTQGTGTAPVTTPASTVSDVAPVPAVTVDGHGNGDTLQVAAGGSALVTVRFSAGDVSNNLSGIRYNVWNPPAGSAVAGTGFFTNGGGFAPQTGGSGEVTQILNLTVGDWYFWTDAQNGHGDSASTGAWNAGFVLHVTQGTGGSSTTTSSSGSASDVAPVPAVTVDGHNSGDTVSVAATGSVTVHFSATDSSNNLSGIRYNIWNPPAGSAVPGAGFFTNGGGFTAESGGSGTVTQTVTLSPGDWYFWTDAQNAHGDSTSTGAWNSGFVLHVTH